MTTEPVERTFTVDGVRRTALLVRPDAASAPRPLVIELHGSGHSGADQLAVSGFAERAQNDGFIVAAPDALTPVRTRPEWPEGRAWNVPGVPLVTGERPEHPPDDVAFVRELIAALIADGSVDSQRVYIAGFSGGARLASYLAGALAGRIAAVGTVAGLRVPPDCGTPLPPIVAIHSRADQINPYDGGADARWDLGVAATEAAIAAREHLRGPETVAYGGVTRRAYTGANGDERLVSYTLDEGLHNWPGSPDVRHRFQYGRTATLDATAVLTTFFLERRAARMTDG
jgi:polyhydroxybutyrate depolymerase